MPLRPDLKKSLSSGDDIEQLQFETLEAQFRVLSVPSPSASLSHGSDDDIDTLHSDNDTLSDSHHKRELLEHYASSSPESYRTSHRAKPTLPRSEPSTPISPATQNTFPLPSRPPGLPDHALARLHANVDSRLQPFWSSAIPNRTIRVSVFCPYPGFSPDPSEGHGSGEEHDQDIEPLAMAFVTTGAQGAFETILNVPWSRLATHPPTLHIAFGDTDVEYPVIVQAEMWAPPPRSPPPPLASSLSYSPYQRQNAYIPPDPPLTPPPPSASSSRLASPAPISPVSPVVRSSVSVALCRAHVPLRVISDIDDTVKHAGVLHGARHVFQNVFVRPLDELVVHSMVEWYRDLWQKGQHAFCDFWKRWLTRLFRYLGVRFHYVVSLSVECTRWSEWSCTVEFAIRVASRHDRVLAGVVASRRYVQPAL
jgi:Phosphatidate phosphatase APP1, catalytic domain